MVWLLLSGHFFSANCKIIIFLDVDVGMLVIVVVIIGVHKNICTGANCMVLTLARNQLWVIQPVEMVFVRKSKHSKVLN